MDALKFEFYTRIDSRDFKLIGIGCIGLTVVPSICRNKFQKN